MSTASLRRSLPGLFLYILAGLLPSLSQAQPERAPLGRGQGQNLQVHINKFFDSGASDQDLNDWHENVLTDLQTVDFDKSSEGLELVKEAFNSGVDRLRGEIFGALNDTAHPERADAVVAKIGALEPFARLLDKDAKGFDRQEFVAHAIGAFQTRDRWRSKLERVQEQIRQFKGRDLVVQADLSPVVERDAAGPLAALGSSSLEDSVSRNVAERGPIQLNSPKAEDGADDGAKNGNANATVPSPGAQGQDMDLDRGVFERHIDVLFQKALDDPEQFAKDFADEQQISQMEAPQAHLQSVFVSRRDYITKAADLFKKDSKAQGRKVEIHVLGPNDKMPDVKEDSIIFRFDKAIDSDKGADWKKAPIFLKFVRPEATKDQAQAPDPATYKDQGLWPFKSLTRRIALRKQDRELRTAALIVVALTLLAGVGIWYGAGLLLNIMPYGGPDAWWAYRFINHVVLDYGSVVVPAAFLLLSVGNYLSVRKSGVGVPPPIVSPAATNNNASTANPGNAASTTPAKPTTWKERGIWWGKMALVTALVTTVLWGIFSWLVGVPLPSDVVPFLLMVAISLTVVGTWTGKGAKAVYRWKTGTSAPKAAASAPAAASTDPEEAIVKSFENDKLGGIPLFQDLPKMARDQHPAANIVDRGVESYERKEYYYAARDGEAGSYDVVRYEIAHPDRTRSIIEGRYLPGEPTNYYFFESQGDGQNMRVRRYVGGNGRPVEFRRAGYQDTLDDVQRNLDNELKVGPNGPELIEGARPERDAAADQFQKMLEADGAFKAFKADAEIPGIFNGGIAKVVRKQYRFTKNANEDILTYEITHLNGSVSIVQIFRGAAQSHRFFEPTADGRVRFRQYQNGELTTRSDGSPWDFELDQTEAMEEATKVIKAWLENGTLVDASDAGAAPAAGPKERVEPKFDIPSTSLLEHLVLGFNHSQVFHQTGKFEFTDRATKNFVRFDPMADGSVERTTFDSTGIVLQRVVYSADMTKLTVESGAKAKLSLESKGFTSGQPWEGSEGVINERFKKGDVTIDLMHDPLGAIRVRIFEPKGVTEDVMAASPLKTVATPQN